MLVNRLRYFRAKVRRAWVDGTLRQKAGRFLVSSIRIPAGTICGHLRLPRADRHLDVAGGFADHRGRPRQIRSGAEHLRRIIAAYQASKELQRTAPPPFAIRGLWSEWIAVNFQRLMGALNSGDTSALAALFENLHREQFTLGAGSSYDEYIRYRTSVTGRFYVRTVWCRYRDLFRKGIPGTANLPIGSWNSSEPSASLAAGVKSQSGDWRSQGLGTQIGGPATPSPIPIGSFGPGAGEGGRVGPVPMANQEIGGPGGPIHYPPVGNPAGIVLDGELIPIHAFRHAYHALEMSEWLRDVPGAVVAEIGGGIGGQAYQMMRRSGAAIAKYLVFDIPEMTSICSYFLLSAFPDRRIRLFGEGPVSTGAAEDYDIAVFPHFAVTALEDRSVDLFHNACSFSEMDSVSSAEYLRVIERACRKYFSHINHETRFQYRNPDGSTSVNRIGSELVPDPRRFKRVFRKPRVFCLPEDRGFRYYEYLYERLTAPREEWNNGMME